MTARVREGHLRLTEAVRRGGTALGEGTLERENPDWVKFARAMMPMMHRPAEMIAAELRKGGEVHKVLDIAASHGIFGISVAKQNPAAQIYASDWKNVLEVGSKNAQAMGVGDRYHLLPGSAFETDFGSGYDLVLVPNFLHTISRISQPATQRSCAKCMMRWFRADAPLSWRWFRMPIGSRRLAQLPSA